MIQIYEVSIPWANEIHATLCFHVWTHMAKKYNRNSENAVRVTIRFKNIGSFFNIQYNSPHFHTVYSIHKDWANFHLPLSACREEFWNLID